jgi:hypothetical protein
MSYPSDGQGRVVRGYGEEAYFGLRIPNSYRPVVGNASEQLSAIYGDLANTMDLALMAQQGRQLSTCISGPDPYSALRACACEPIAC